MWGFEPLRPHTRPEHDSNVMEITKENIDALNGVLTVKVHPEDYKEKVDGILEDYRKQVKMPGFRTGKVPIQLVRKQYGKAVLADELNKLLGEKMDGYIREEKLRLLGQPIPAKENDSEGNWEKPDVFTFRYDIGLSPKVDIKFGWFTKFVNHKVRIDDALIDEQIGDLRRRYGKMSEREEMVRTVSWSVSSWRWKVTRSSPAASCTRVRSAWIP